MARLLLAMCRDFCTFRQPIKRNTPMEKAPHPPLPAAEPAFHCRSYGKAELAQLYLPHIQPASARKAFNEWIAANPYLEQQLCSKGLLPQSKRYTPAQVRLIVEVLGEP